jgi:hypothetical protein
MRGLKTQLRFVSFLCLIVLSWSAAFGQITPLGDAYTNTADPTTNYGAATLLDVDGAQAITYIQFDLASIPTTASISQATLKLYVNSVTTAGSFNVDYVNGAWAENTIDASNAPALGKTIESDVALTTADKNQYILINVTSAVQAWLSGSETNNGIALVANGSFIATFDSKENTATSHAAELDIAFAGGDGTITGVTTASGSGLTGGGTSGTLSLGLSNACAANQVLQWNGTGWVCSSAGTGTVSSVGSGTGLTGGPITGSGTLSIAPKSCVAGDALSALPFTCSPFAALGANTFTGVQTINNTTFISGTNSSGVLQVTNTAMSGTPAGIVGTTNSTNASGVKGVAPATTGTVNGVFGTTASTTGYGVQGQSPNVGVYGQASGASEEGAVYHQAAGLWGDTGQGSFYFYSGAFGTADDESAGAFYNNGGAATLYGEDDLNSSGAIAFEAGMPNFLNVYSAIGDPGCGPYAMALQLGATFIDPLSGCANYTLYGDQAGDTSLNAYASGLNAPGDIYLRINNGNQMTVSSGGVDVIGTLSKGGGSFKIDHPLDPANKYLYHSFVESPDMKDMYDGNVTTDEAGMATVTLPDWFEALNRDFRYHLTVIGQFAQAIVASKVANNQFSIRTNKPNVKVSWQVTGIRQDAFANANRIPVEVEKAPADRGRYLYPKLYGAPETARIGYQPPSALAPAGEKSASASARPSSAGRPRQLMPPNRPMPVLPKLPKPQQIKTPPKPTTIQALR